MNYPRVWDGSAYTRRLHPISCKIKQSLQPLSTVNMTLPAMDEISNLDWVEMPIPDGSVEYYRVASVATDAESGEKTVYLEHGACLLDDMIIPETGALRAINLSGTARADATAILNYQPNSAFVKWHIGTVETDETIYVEPGDMSLMTALLTMMQTIPRYQLEFEQVSATDWRVNIRLRGTEASPVQPFCEGRLSRNLKECDITYSTDGLCTRVYSEFLKTVTQGGKDYMDAGTVNQYGIHAETMSLNDNLTPEQKVTIIETYLNVHGLPKVSVSISGVELSQVTGLQIDNFKVGKVCRIVIPWLGIIRDEVIVDKTYSDPYNFPESVQISLANSAPDLSIAIAAITGGGGVGGGGGGGGFGSSGKGGKEAEKKRYETKFEQTDRYFRLLATDTEWDSLGNGTVKSYGQLVINSDAFQTVVSNERAQTTSQITQTADSVTSLVIGTTASDVFVGDGTKGTEEGKKYKVKTRDAQGNPLTWEPYEPVQSQIEQLAGEINLTVSKTTFENTLKGYLKIAPDSAGIGVVAVDDNGYKITSAEIINAINGDNTSSTTIHADHVFLDAAKTVKISDVLFIAKGGNFWVKRNATFGSEAGKIITINGGTVNAPTLQVNSGGNLKFASSTSTQGVITIDRATAADIITGVQIDGPDNNVYTLQYQKVGTGDTWNNAKVTFSRAITSWDASGSGGTITVTAQPQNQSYTLVQSVKGITVDDGKLTKSLTANVYKEKDGGVLVTAQTVTLVEDTTNKKVQARLGGATGTAIAEIAITASSGDEYESAGMVTTVGTPKWAFPQVAMGGTVYWSAGSQVSLPTGTKTVNVAGTGVSARPNMTEYNSGLRIQLWKKVGTNSYSSAGNHYWYYNDDSAQSARILYPVTGTALVCTDYAPFTPIAEPYIRVSNVEYLYSKGADRTDLYVKK